MIFGLSLVYPSKLRIKKETIHVNRIKFKSSLNYIELNV